MLLTDVLYDIYCQNNNIIKNSSNTNDDLKTVRLAKALSHVVNMNVEILGINGLKIVLL